MNIIEETERIYPKVVEMRRHLHENPELSEHEKETSEFVAARLAELGIPFSDHVAGYGIVAQIGTGDHAVGIRADMDALPVTEATGLACSSKNPGVMHACGHDFHTAILLGVAELLKKYEDEVNAKHGAVKLFFQPSEETVGGADRMIKEGWLENPKVTAMIALHVDPNYPSGKTVLRYGPMNAETQDFRLKAIGTSCHGAHPEKGIDAIVMASSMIMELQTISSRYNAPTTPVIVTVGTITAGDAGNVVAGEAVMTGTMRALEPGVMAENKKLFEMIVNGVAASYGGRAEVKWGNDGYPALINDDDINDCVRKNAVMLFGEDNIEIMPDASLGGDDFAFFTKRIKGAYFNIGTAAEGAPYYALHNEHFSPDESAMKTGIAVNVATALDLL